MTGMKQEFGYFLKNAKFRAALGLTLLLSYGYAIATTRVSIDSLEGDRYIGTGGVMLSTGRFGMNLWAAVLGYGRAEPSYAFGIDLLAALLLALAAVSFCALLRKAAQDRISMFGYGLFACLFVSYPLMNEIWEYSGANVCVCGGYLLDAAALNLLLDARQPGVPWRGRALRMGAAALCLMVVCSSYESLAAVFVLAVFALLTLEQLLAAERPRLAAVLTEGLWYAAALVGGLCLRVLVTSAIHLVLPQAAANGATEILWAFYPFVYLAKLLVKGILINYALRGCFYLPIAELAVAVPVFVALVIVLAVLMYFQEKQKVDSCIKEKRKQIEFDLPRFVYAISQEIQMSHDVISILERHKDNFSPYLNEEIEITIADMRTGNYEAAITRFEGRIGSTNLSEVCRGFIQMIRGDDTSVYWETLAIRFSELQKQYLRNIALKIPPKVHRLSFFLMMSMMLLYVVVLGWELLSNMGVLFG